MAPRPASSEEDPDDIDPPEEEHEPGSRPEPHAPPPRAARPHPLRGWTASGAAPSEGEGAEAEAYYRTGRRRKRRTYWRARDSAFFAPLVALAILIVLVVGLYAYAQNWPPVYVVESGSMQHGSGDTVGLLNPGDLVLAQKIAVSQIITYIVGMEDNHATYGEWGDVILYYPNGQAGTPVIHRPLVYVEWNPANSTFAIPELQSLACGSEPGAVYSTSLPPLPAGCRWDGLHNGTTLDLYHVGWKSANVSVTLGSAQSGAHSGFITMGDNNFVCSSSGCTGEADQGAASISGIVEPGWVVGVARGMLPWFGAIKLFLEGNAGAVPPQSWQFLGLTIAALVGLAFAVHYALGSVRPRDPRRVREEEAAEEREEAAEAERERSPEPLWRRWIPHWPKKESPPDDAKAAPRRSGGRGRPAPAVRRRTHDSSDRGKDDEL